MKANPGTSFEILGSYTIPIAPVALLSGYTPKIVLEEETGPGTKWDESFAHVAFENISAWDEFSTEVIDELFGDETLRQGLSWTLLDDMALRSACQDSHVVKKEKHVDSIVEKCLVKRLLKTIDFCGNNVRQRLGMSPLQPKMEFEGTFTKVDGQSYRKKMDWPIYYEYPGSTARKVVLVAGDSKRDHVFQPEWLENRVLFRAKKASVTLGQLGMYAFWGKTRYAYVVTSRTLTVLRYYLISQKEGKIQLGVHYKAIDWNSPQGHLSVCKAIWALAMLSMDDDNREVVQQHAMHPLGKWWETARRVAKSPTKTTTASCSTSSVCLVAETKCDSCKALVKIHKTSQARIRKKAKKPATLEISEVSGSSSLTTHPTSVKSPSTLCFNVIFSEKNGDMDGIMKSLKGARIIFEQKRKKNN